MSDRFHASIQIGGPVSKALIPALTARISDAGLLYPGDALKQHLDEDSLLVLEDEQASYGEFPELEGWLQRHLIEFDRFSSGYFDLLPEWVSFRKMQGRTLHLLDGRGDQVISHRDVQQALSDCLSLQALQATLTEILGPEVSPLQPINLSTKETATP